MTESMGVDKAKRTAKDRDGWECRFCGMTNDEHTNQYDRGLHAHHIVKDGDDGADHPRNLITVCRDCHNTLENTQADALSRIRNEHTERLQETVERQEQHIQDLESGLEACTPHSKTRELVSTIHGLAREVRQEPNVDVYAWLEERFITVHILVEGALSPTIRTFTDAEQAAEAYRDSDSAIKLINTTKTITHAVEENLQFQSSSDVTLRFNDSGGSYFEESDGVEGSYLSSDIPSELRGGD